MANLDDLAELIARHRAAAARQFDSEIEKLRHTYGPAVVSKAMELASRQGDRRDAISITASRARHQAECVPLPPSTRGVYRRRDVPAGK